MGKKSTVRRVLVLIFALALFAVVPGALADEAFDGGLVGNGSFETPAIPIRPEPTIPPTNSYLWGMFDSAAVGWDIEWVSDSDETTCSEDPRLELDTWVPGEPHGDQVASLDTHCFPTNEVEDQTVSSRVKISQELTTIASCQYDLGFSWRTQTNRDWMEVTAPDFTEAYGGVSYGTRWHGESVPFIAEAATSMISFEATASSFADSTDETPIRDGMYLDAVSVMVDEGYFPTTTVDLIADGGNPSTAVDAGDVTVWVEGDMLYVDFDVVAPWLVAKTHVAVVDDLADFPQTKKGNPKPGKFPYGETYSPWSADPAPIGIDVSELSGVIYVAAHAELMGGVVGPYWADGVVFSDQLLTKGGDPVAEERTYPDNALGAPSVDDDLLFFALGYGGEIVVEFEGWIYNVAGSYDISVHETTWNEPLEYPEETADVYGWYDNDWEFLGEVSNHDQNPGEDVGVGLVELGDLPYVEKVKIVDTTDDPSHKDTADGYDVDAVDAVSLLLRGETGWGDGDRFVEKGNWGMYFDNIVQCNPGG